MEFTCTFGESITEPKEVHKQPLKDVLWMIQWGEQMEFKIADLRMLRIKMDRGEDCEDKYKQLKKELPYFVASSVSDKRHRDSFIMSNGAILDIDKIESPEEVLNLKSQFERDPYVHFCFISPSGNGLKVGFILDKYITSPSEYTKVYKYLGQKVSESYGVEVDKTSDCVRACFLSYDPGLYFNPESKKWPAYYPPEKIEVFTPKTPVYDKSGFESDYDKALRLASISPMISAYKDWYRCGMALKDEFGDSGLEIWLTLSMNKGSNDTRESLTRKYDSFSYGGEVHIGTYFEILKKYGVDISTKKIEKI